jgi:integrase
MATIYLSLSSKTDTTRKQELLIRFSHGRINQRAKTNIFIPSEYWDSKAQQIIIPNFRLMNDEKRELKKDLTDQSEKLNALITAIQTLFNNAGKDNITSGWLKTEIDKYNFPEKYLQKDIDKTQPFFDAFEEFLKIRKFSKPRFANYNVVVRALKRYEMYVQTVKYQSFSLALDSITPAILSDFDNFLRGEHFFSEQYSEMYKKVLESRKPEPRGQNTINGIFTKIRTFFIWSVDNGKTSNNPFRKFKIEECVYGTPYYISIDDRNKLYNTDFSHRPALAIQRDIFVFQCLIGCRVADLYKLTKQNIINGAIEYIARKIKDGRPVTVRVPHTRSFDARKYHPASE